MANSIYGIELQTLDGKPTSMDSYRGKVLLIVNTASECGFTPQYAGLQALHERYHDRGLAVLGFPCNQFGAQEPGTADQIAAFCQNNYGVSFPMHAKVDVNGPDAHPLFQHLKDQGEAFAGDIKWNFSKFLVDTQGQVVGRYPPDAEPEAIASDIEPLLPR